MSSVMDEINVKLTRLEVRDGEMVIIHTNHRMPADFEERFRQWRTKAGLPNVMFMVLGRDDSVEIVSPQTEDG